MSDRKTVLSCIQPTGDMHFGNYFGAVKNWVNLQETYDCLYGVVDYHAMTMPYNPKKLKENTWELIYNLLAVGIKKEHLFIQSLVPEHAELCWILNNFAAYGRVENMTQFKDKSLQNSTGKEGFISVGLYDYPVLQAADILIYRADYVPVGEDQKQHLELTKEIANRFNNQVGKEYFVLPQMLRTKTPKIMSTADPTRKMSKSAGPKHNISLFEEEARIRKQIGSAVTDSGDTPEGQMSVGIHNLFQLLIAADQQTVHDQLMATYNDGQLKYSDLKQAVADSLVALRNEFVEKKQAITADKKTVKNNIKYASHEIRKKAMTTVREVKELCGLSNVKNTL